MNKNLKFFSLIIFCSVLIFKSLPVSATIFATLPELYEEAAKKIKEFLSQSGRKVKTLKETPILHIYISPFNPEISKDGLRLIEFFVVHAELKKDGSVVMRTSEVKVGEPIVVIFTIQNTTKKTLVFKKYGIFVGCRWKPKKGILINRDFGYHKNVMLKPGKSFTLTAQIIVDKPGTWYFWPAYLA